MRVQVGSLTDGAQHLSHAPHRLQTAAELNTEAIRMIVKTLGKKMGTSASERLAAEGGCSCVRGMSTQTEHV